MRHRQRHVHASIVQYIKANLDNDGWTATPANFGTTPVTVVDYQPLEAGETPAFNTVSISMGDEGDDRVQQMGGGLHACRYTVFVDVYAEKEPIGVAITDDIKGYLTEEIIPLRDFTTSAAGVVVDGAEIEFELVMVEKIPTATTTLDKRTWRAVKFQAVCYFPN